MIPPVRFSRPGRLVGTVLGGLLAGCGTSPNTATCDTLGLEVPTPRGEVSAVYDAPRQRLIVVAGNEAVPVDCQPGSTDYVADTWAWREDCGAFQQFTGDGPSARARYAIGLPDGGDTVYLHGGKFRRGSSGDYKVFDDTWALDLTTDTWSKVTTTGSPGKRSNHGGAFV
ncbi:MAG: hypothetical protein H6733_07615, partial [Alphaproteobacteria bacterium]|nr:hypothetical protein [Alphaproteobacteria bacterium]